MFKSKNTEKLQNNKRYVLHSRQDNKQNQKLESAINSFTNCM